MSGEEDRESVSHEEILELNKHLLKYHHPCDVSAPAKLPPAEETLKEDITYIRQALVRLEDDLERIKIDVQCQKKSCKGCSC